jgi:hypothetical protein
MVLLSVRNHIFRIFYVSAGSYAKRAALGKEGIELAYPTHVMIAAPPAPTA